MSDTTGFTQAYGQASDAFTKFVPGFEFLQGLVKNAGKALPPMGQWVAPTLDPAELERRIEELKTVQFWLEQNARMLGATIQALEVQRMTLGTLKGMNVSMGDLTEALKMRVPDMFSGMAAAAESASQAATANAWTASAPAPAPAAPSPSASEEGATGPVDAMNWWGALTQQFTELAAQAIQATSDAARQASEATSDAASQASQAVQAATAAATEAAVEAAKPMTDAVNEVVSQSAKAAGTAAKAAKAAAAPASPAKPRAPAKKSGARATPGEATASPKATRRRAS
jgi:hypothetical protein